MPANDPTRMRGHSTSACRLPNLYSKFITIVPPVSPRSRLARLYARAIGLLAIRNVTVAIARLTLSCGREG